MKSIKKNSTAVRVFFALGLCLIAIGVTFILIGSFLLQSLVTSNLKLIPQSRLYDVWSNPPISASVDFYFFNWTNPEHIYNKSVKPKFEQVGPYRFSEHQSKSDIVWNKNGTVSFQRLKFWKYREEEDNGNLDDNITNINPVALASAHVARTWNYLIRKSVSLTLANLAPSLNITRTARELLFEGYPDNLMKIANTFPIFGGKDIPKWEKFGWFYARNGSSDFDGVFNMGTGIDTNFGEVYSWNHRSKTFYFEGECGKVEGFLGDLFAPCENKQFVTLFSSDLCRKIVLEFAGKSQVGDIIGYKYVAGDYMFDNGTLYPANECFCGGECLPSGVFNVSSCRFGSPSFASLPHFYKADAYYGSLIEGMRPDGQKHDFFVILEPTTGIPLEMCVRLQLNLLLHPIPGILMYENAPTIFLPMIWFEQKFKIPESKTFVLKLLLKIPIIFSSAGIILTISGLIFVIYGCHKRFSKVEKSNDQFSYQQEMVPLSNKYNESTKFN